LVGCTPSEVPPKEEVPAVAESPVPVWTDEELEVIGAVETYLQVWTEISQDLAGSDWSRILDVATGSAANLAQLRWSDWSKQGLHLVGTPVLTFDHVSLGGLNDEGQRFHVYGCFSIEDSTLVNSSGQPVGEGRIERSIAIYEVIRYTKDGIYLVTEDGGEDTAC
jgi:hypothetical protein